jgi:hypothetical protein
MSMYLELSDGSNGGGLVTSAVSTLGCRPVAPDRREHSHQLADLVRGGAGSALGPALGVRLIRRLGKAAQLGVER